MPRAGHVHVQSTVAIFSTCFFTLDHLTRPPSRLCNQDLYLPSTPFLDPFPVFQVLHPTIPPRRCAILELVWWDG